MTTNHDALREAAEALQKSIDRAEALAASNPEQASGEQEDDETPAPSLPPNQYVEFWERLPGHLIDNHEGEELTEELLQRAAADLYATFPELVESGLKPFGLLLLEERATTRQLTRALREATEAPTFMGEPVATPNTEPAAPVAAKPRCNYPECTRACGDAKGYCHKAAKPEPQAQAGEPHPINWVDYARVAEAIAKKDAKEQELRQALQACLEALKENNRVQELGRLPDAHWESVRELRRDCDARIDAAITHANQVLEGGGK